MTDFTLRLERTTRHGLELYVIYLGDRALHSFFSEPHARARMHVLSTRGYVTDTGELLLE